MRDSLTRERLGDLMKELARTAPPRRAFRVYLVGGGTAVLSGWRESTIDANLYSADDAVFRDIQNVKERLRLNVEFARPEDFVPELAGSDLRHVFITTYGKVSFYHYDPYAQVLSKVVRGFSRDIQDATCFLSSGMVEAGKLRSLVKGIPPAAFARYPALSRKAVLEALDDFLVEHGP